MAQTVEIIKVFHNANYAVVYWEKNSYTPYVACWAPMVWDEWDKEYRTPNEYCTGERKMYWGQGHYFTNKEDALAYATEQEREAVEYKIEGMREYLRKLEI